VTSGGWHPDAQGFLDRWLRQRRLSAQQFLAQRPGWPWGKLLRELDEPVAPVQLIAFLQAAAVRDGWVDWFARDTLARALRERRLRRGWRSRGAEGAEMDFPTAMALSDWVTTMGTWGEDCRDLASQVVEALLRAEAPKRWRPSGADDPLLMTVFSTVSFDDCR
jgi:hypothetical protein